MLGFLELPEEEVPPELIWHNDSRMEEWWLAVKESRKNPGAGPPDVEYEQTQNALAERYR